MATTDLTDFEFTDLVDDHSAADVNELHGGVLNVQYANTETLSATFEMTDADCQFQFLTASGGNQTVELAVEATTNHFYIIFNSGSSNSIVVKDDAGSITYATLAPDEYAVCIPLASEGWRVWQQVVETKYLLSPSVTSNNLTLDVTHLDGSNPSTTRPLMFIINGVKRYATSALSVTVTAGTDIFNAGDPLFATIEQDFFAYIGYNATDGVVLGISRIPYATVYGDFSTTSTAETYAKISTITNAVSTDDYMVIGRFAATNSGTASYNWSVPTYTSKTLIHQPIWETRWLSYDPNPTGGGSLTISSYNIDFCRYKFVRDTCKSQARIDTIATSGTADNTITTSIPITAADANMPGAGQYVDGGTQLLMQVYISDTTTLRCRKDDNSNWSNAASDIRLFWTCDYPIKI